MYIYLFTKGKKRKVLCGITNYLSMTMTNPMTIKSRKIHAMHKQHKVFAKPLPKSCWFEFKLMNEINTKALTAAQHKVLLYAENFLLSLSRSFSHFSLSSFCRTLPSSSSQLYRIVNKSHSCWSLLYAMEI